MVRDRTLAIPLLMLIVGCHTDENRSPQIRDKERIAMQEPSQQWDGEFKEDVLTGIKWGISKSQLRKAYRHGGELFEPVPDILQDLSMPIHGHEAIGGFSFGQNGLHMLAASLLFEVEGKRLYHRDVLAKSSTILSQLKQTYGEPWISIPWDGRTFQYIWRSDETFVQFAWDGGDGWGIHYRSMKLDGDIPQIISNLEQLKKQL